MCDNNHLSGSVIYENHRFDYHNESLDYEEAKTKCECENGRLAMPKTEDSFNFISAYLQELNSNARHWRIGLKRNGTRFIWGDGVEQTHRPEYSLNGTGNCVSIYVNHGSSFLRPLQCKYDKSHSGLFGYICSYSTQNMVKLNPVNSTLKDVSGTNFYEDSLGPTEANGYIPPHSSAEDAIMWTILVILVVMVVVTAIPLVRRALRKIQDHELDSLSAAARTNDALEHDETVFGSGTQVNNAGDGSTHYLTIDEVQSMGDPTRSRGASSSVFYEEMQSNGSLNVKDVYAVVHKENHHEHESRDEQFLTTYAVVNKPKTASTN